MSFDLSENTVSSSNESQERPVTRKAGLLPVLAASLLPASCITYRDQFAEEAQRQAVVEALYAKIGQEINREVGFRLNKAIRQALAVFSQEELYSLVHEAVVEVVPDHLKIEEQHLAKSVSDEIMQRISADNKLSLAFASWQRDPQILRRTMLEPTVQLSLGTNMGAGVIVHQETLPDSGGYRYYILSCWHTFRDELDRYENALKEIKNDEAETKINEPKIEVKVYTGQDSSLESAKIIYSKADKDLSLLVMHSRLDLPSANFCMDYRESKLQVFSPVIAIGCPLGSDPLPTMGIVSDMVQEHEGGTYMMTTAATHIGNSGGPIYSLETGEIEAIVSKVYLSGKGSPSVVSHMGLAVTRQNIYDLLRESRIFSSK